jgi:hypothetical protein
MNMRTYYRNELARCINCARHATRVAHRPFYNKEGCLRTAHDYIVKAVAAREELKRMGFKLP